MVYKGLAPAKALGDEEFSPPPPIVPTEVGEAADAPKPQLADVPHQDVQDSTEPQSGSAPVLAPKKDDKAQTKRLFGLTRQKQPAYIQHDDYEQRYPPDELGDEMGPNSRVWRVYLDEAELNDHDLVEGWKDAMDVLLVFAGLFSAVVTTFVVQTSQKLDVDYGQVSASLLTELIAVQRASWSGLSPNDVYVPLSTLNMTSSAQFSTTDAWVNGLWFTSLSLSLVVALAGVLIKQWIQHYVSFISGASRERARIHHFRYMGVQRWSLPAIIGMLPFLLHAALFLFILGLVVLLQALKIEIACAIGAIGGCAFALYFTSTALPLYYPQCPYRTPLIEHGRSVVSFGIFAARRISFPLTHRIIPQLLFQYRSKFLSFEPLAWLDDWCQKMLGRSPPSYSLKPLKSFEFNAALELQDEVTSEIIHWLISALSNPSIKPVALQAISGLRIGFSSINHLLGHGSVVREELLREVDRQQSIAVEASQVLDSFFDSPLFYDLERLLRACMYVPEHKRKIYTVINLPGHVEHESVQTQSGQAFVTYVIDQCWNLHSTSDVMYWLAFASAVAEKRPTVWHAWSNILHVLPPLNADGPYLGLPTVHYSYYQIFRPLIAPASSAETWTAILPLISQIIRLDIEESGDLLDFPEDLDLMTKGQLFRKKIDFFNVILKRAASECQTDPRKIEHTEKVVSTLLDICSGLVSQDYNWKYCSLAITAVARVCDQPFFINNTWSWFIYYRIFDIFILGQSACVLSTRPYALLSTEFISRCLKSRASAHGLLYALQISRNDSKGIWVDIVRHQADQIISILEGGDVNGVMHANVFGAFADIARYSLQTQDVGPMETGKQWPSPLQHFMQWMLSQVIKNGESGYTDLSINVFSAVLTDLEHSDLFIYVCSTFLLFEERITNTRKRMNVTFSEESSILLQLAVHHKSHPATLSIWHRFLAMIAAKSTQVRSQEWEHKDWHKEDFERYACLVSFVGHLGTILGLSGPEFTMAKLDDTSVADQQYHTNSEIQKTRLDASQDDETSVDEKTPTIEAPRRKVSLFKKLLPWKKDVKMTTNQQEIRLESQEDSPDDKNLKKD